jgi:hypothetical protein
MRPYVALVVLLVVQCVPADAHSTDRQCSAEAEVKGFKGPERSRFITKCKATIRYEHKDDSAACRRSEPSSGWAAVLMGACPLCLILSGEVESDGNCSTH